MKHGFSLSAIILLSAVCISACKKKVSYSTPVNSSMEKQLYFKAGTYWIYRDSLTGKEDSCAVIHNYKESRSGDDHEYSLMTGYNNINFISEWELAYNTAIFSYNDLRILELPYPVVETQQLINNDTLTIRNDYNIIF